MLPLDCELERTRTVLAHFTGFRPGSFGEDHHRDVRGKPLTRLIEGGASRRGVATFERNVTRQPHHPTEDRDLHNLGLREPLKLGRQVRDEQDVDEALVVRDGDVGTPHVVWQRARGREPPEWVQCRMNPCQLPKHVASRVGALVERHRDQPDDCNEGREDTDEQSKNDPTPDAQDRPGQLRFHWFDLRQAAPSRPSPHTVCHAEV